MPEDTNPPAETLPADPQAAETSPAEEPTPPPAASDDAKRQEAERRLRRKNEELEAKIAELTRSQMDEQERAVADAKAAARTEALSEAGKRIASAEVRAALTGIVPDPNAVVEDLALEKFVTADGEVDAAKVADLRAKYQAFAPTAVRQPTAEPQGGGAHAPSLEEQIAAARAAGDTSRAIQLNMRMLAESAGAK